MKALTRRVFGVFAAVAIAAVSGACSSASDSGQVDQPETIRLGAIATGSAPEEKVRYQQIADQLEAELGMPVDLVTSTDYYAIAEGLRGDHIDVAFLNSLGFVLTESKASIEPIAVGVDDTGRPGYYSFLVTNQPDEIKGPADVQGRTLALSGRLSTSGYLYPLRALQQAGLSPEEDTTLSSGGNHAANILAVASGQVEAAFVDSVEYEAAVRKGKVDPAQVVKVWESDRITGSPVVMRTELDPALREQITQAVLGLTGTAEVPIGVEKSTKMAPIVAADYEPIRELARAAGLKIDDMKK